MTRDFKIIDDTDLEPGRDPLVHLEVLLGAVECARVLSPGHFPRREVPDAVVETDLAQLVVVGQKVLEGPDLLGVQRVGGRGRAGHDVINMA